MLGIELNSHWFDQVFYTKASKSILVSITKTRAIVIESNNANNIKLVQILSMTMSPPPSHFINLVKGLEISL